MIGLSSSNAWCFYIQLLYIYTIRLTYLFLKQTCSWRQATKVFKWSGKSPPRSSTIFVDWLSCNLFLGISYWYWLLRQNIILKPIRSYWSLVARTLLILLSWVCPVITTSFQTTTSASASKQSWTDSVFWALLNCEKEPSTTSPKKCRCETDISGFHVVSLLKVI